LAVPRLDCSTRAAARAAATAPDEDRPTRRRSRFGATAAEPFAPKDPGAEDEAAGLLDTYL
jgi:hypothetical protein